MKNQVNPFQFQKMKADVGKNSNSLLKESMDFLSFVPDFKSVSETSSFGKDQSEFLFQKIFFDFKSYNKWDLLKDFNLFMIICI